MYCIHQHMLMSNKLSVTRTNLQSALNTNCKKRTEMTSGLVCTHTYPFNMSENLI